MPVMTTHEMVLRAIFTLSSLSLIPLFIIHAIRSDLKSRKLHIERLYSEGLFCYQQCEPPVSVSRDLCEYNLIPAGRHKNARFIATDNREIWALSDKIILLQRGNFHTQLVYAIIQVHDIIAKPGFAMHRGAATGYAEKYNTYQIWDGRSKYGFTTAWNTATEVNNYKHLSEIINSQVLIIWASMECDYIAFGHSICVVGARVKDKDYYAAWTHSIKVCKAVQSELSIIK